MEKIVLLCAWLMIGADVLSLGLLVWNLIRGS